MSDIVPFKCQFCGSQDGLFRANAKPKSYKDPIGSDCSNCGHIFSDDDVKKATREIATLLAKDAFQRQLSWIGLVVAGALSYSGLRLTARVE